MSTSSPTLSVNTTCPACRSAGGLPCSIVHAKGTMTGTAATPYGLSDVVLQTAFARRAAPPLASTPRTKSFPIGGAVAAAVLGFVPVLIFVPNLAQRLGVRTEETTAVVFFAWLMLPVIGALAGFALARFMGPAREEQEYPAQLALWHRTWMCQSCGQTWLP